MAYFRYFPKVAYDVRGVIDNTQYDLVTNLLSRVLVKCHGWKDVDGSAHEALVGTCNFQKYLIRDGDKPETLAHQFYGDSELHWIILYTNGSSFQNPYYDWPMTHAVLTKFVEKKYGSDNIYDTNHYENGDGYQVDSDASGATAVTHFLHEERLNDAKRTIRIMDRQYIDLVIDEFKHLMKQHK
jgi:hypothetical protein